MSKSQQILVAGPAWVGDMVMAQSLFITLKQRPHPVEIDVLAPAWSNPILSRMSEVRDIINLPVAHGELGLGRRYQLGKSLRGKHYDQAIITPRSYKAALVPFFAGAKRRTGYRGEMRFGVINDMRPLDKSVLRQTVHRYVALGLESDASQPPAIPYPGLDIDKDNLDRLLDELELNLNTSVIAMMPGAEYGEAKRWPLDYYGEVATRLIEKGNQVWLLGSEKDKAAGEVIAKNNSAINLCGKTRLEDTIDLLSACKVAVTNDSGLMHIAAAVDVPLVAIYGSSTPDYTPPLTDKATIEYLGLECSPCFKRVCPFGHTNCLKGISSQKVLDAINGII